MPGLEGTVDVPVAGKVPKKLAVGGLLVVGTLVIVYYARKRKSGAAPAAAATATNQFPPDGTTGNPQDPYSTDPATGQTYGNESVGSGGTFGAFTGGAPGGGGGGNGASSGNPATPGGPPFASNDAWSNWAIQELSALNPNLDTGALTDALGVYLQGGQVTPTQKTLVFDALAVAGDPPVAGAGGFPPKVKTQPINNHTTEVVPNVTGDRVENANSALESLGLKSSFGARKPGVPYVVSAQSPTAGHRVAEGSTVHLTIREENAPRPREPQEIPGGPIRR